MRNWLHVSFILACVIFASVAGSSIITRAQQQRPAEQTPDKVVISKNEVPFDVVVRDKKGRPVKDLNAADFEVYEDGVKQEITSFRFVSSGPTAENNGPTSTDTKQNAGAVTPPAVTPPP